MKRIKNIFKIAMIAFIACMGWTSCVDLEQTPLSSLPGETYFETDAQLQTYVDNLYAPRESSGSFTQVFDVHGSYNYGVFGFDDNSDNMAQTGANVIWRPADYRVDQTGGEWSFTYIYRCNYFFNFVLPKYEASAIQGNATAIKQFIGEVYFLRAFEYFKKLQRLGDFPIVTEMLPDDMVSLIEASKRQPRTDVAHFILEDLDKAIDLLNDDVAKTRITRKAALLFKSRVALYEGTWTKYFKGTAFVPNGPEWPGAAYNPDYQFPKGSIDAEIDFFLGEAMNAAKEVASTSDLVNNTGSFPQSMTDADNPFLRMYGDENLNGYPEVIMWRQYSKGLGITHSVCMYTTAGNNKRGLTRGFVNNFLMDDGSPIYASGGRYQGDDLINNVRINRDGRLQVFLKAPGDVNYFQPGGTPERCYNVIEPVPDVTLSDTEKGYNGCYPLRKGLSPVTEQYTANNGSYTGCIIFRAAEAYLNYIEACYEKNGTLDNDAQNYWVKIRSRANAGAATTWSDIQTNTIAKTIMANEALNDFGAYSAGEVLTDKVLYNIRRERRMELMAEGLRLPDLKRWRACDQLINTGYHIEGIKFWGPNFHLYTLPSGDVVIPCEYEGTAFDGLVSPKSDSEYLRPFEIKPTDPVKMQGGLRWKMAHYLYPIAVDHILIASEDGKSVATSTIYQNPYWPTVAEGTAEK